MRKVLKPLQAVMGVATENELQLCARGRHHRALAWAAIAARETGADMPDGSDAESGQDHLWVPERLLVAVCAVHASFLLVLGLANYNPSLSPVETALALGSRIQILLRWSAQV